jgi:hypothetical protein
MSLLKPTCRSAAPAGKTIGALSSWRIGLKPTS